jgi:hypothetical protein
MQGQLDQQSRMQQMQRLPGQFMQKPATMDNRDVGLLGEQQPQFDAAGYGQALMGLDPMAGLQFQQATKKAEPALHTAKPGEVGGTFVNGVWTQAFAVPDKATDDPFVRLLKSSGIDPASPQGQKLLAQRLAKEATHQPPVSLNNYGSPLPISLPGGQEGYIQPPSRAGGPSQILRLPGTDQPAIKPGEKPKDLNDAQSKANLFGTRAQEANKIVSKLAGAGTTSPSFAQQVTNADGIGGRVATALATPQQQQIDQAQRDFINAVLRRESGAVINPGEFTNARAQYFVQPGDKPAVIAQKARNRQIAVEGILAEVPAAKRGVPTVNAENDAGNSDPLGLR